MYLTSAETIVLQSAACVWPVDKRTGDGIAVFLDVRLPLACALSSLSVVFMAATTAFVLLMLEIASLQRDGTSVLRDVAYVWATAILTALLAVISYYLTHLGKYRAAVAWIVAALACEGWTFLVLSSLDHVAGSGVYKGLVGLHCVLCVLCVLFGMLWHRAVQKVRRPHLCLEWPLRTSACVCQSATLGV